MKRILPHLPLALIVVGLTINSHQSTFDAPDFGLVATDKLMHAAAFAVIALAALYSGRPLPIRNVRIYALVWVVGFGLFDEIHQAFVPGRSAEVLDWVADCVGGGIAIALAGDRITRRAGRRNVER